jgi:hypothetical protein
MVSLMRLLNSDLRWYRDRLVALSACALVALSLAFGLVPSTAHASIAPSCTGLDGAQGPLFFIPSSNSATSLQPTPASGSTVAALSTVYAVYHDETKLLDTVGDTVPGPVHALTFTYTGPTSGSVTPIFTTLAAGTGFDTMLPADDDAWVAPADRATAPAEEKAESGWPHPDQEFDHVVKISGVIPNLTTSGDYLFHLQTNDGDNNAPNGVGDCGFAEWRLHVKAQPEINTTPSAGGAIGTVIHDTATLSGGQSPTGDVTFKLYAPGDTTCATPLSLPDPTEPLSGVSATSDSFTTTAVGTYHWTATYKGDDNNATASSGCGAEPVTITKAQPGIGTTPSAGGVIGTVIHDTATVSGGNSPTGDVTFKLYAPGDTTCATPLSLPDPTEPLSGLTATSDSFTTTAVGTYRWTATYNGDPSNFTATSGCQDEQVTTTKAQPGISTTPSAGGPIGTAINDSASVTGGYSPTGTVTFRLYAPSDATCDSAAIFTDTQNLGVVSGDYTTAAVGTYHWKATYNGDANNLTASSGCQDEQVTTTKANGTIATVAAGANLVAGTAGLVSDSASFSGAFHPTGNVVFTLYNSDCSQSTGITGSGAISNAGTASFSSAWTPAAAGTYNWRATYAGDANNAAFAGCHDPNEQVTVSNPPASGTQSASTGGIEAATTRQPNTGHSDFARNMFLAMVMVMLGITALAGQALFTSMRKEEQ